MKFLAVGDIHGSASQLRILLSLEPWVSNRQVVFLGDYVDVGLESKEVLELLLLEESRDRGDRSFLLGNHDAALLEFLQTGDFGAFAALGGIATIKSYCGEHVYGDVRQALEEAMPATHCDFLRRLLTVFETDEFLFSHAGYSPSAPLDRSVAAMVRTNHQDLFRGHLPLSKTAVCGHYFQQTHRPYVSERLICVDTGCGVLGGPLTGLALPERTAVQVWPDSTVTTLQAF